jgi:GT2 family glycosyltransferase
MRVSIFVPTRGFIYAETVQRLNLDGLVYSIMTGGVSWSNTMNRCVEAFLNQDADVFVALDDDTIPPEGFLDGLLAGIEAGYDIVGAPTLIAKPGSIFLPNIYTVRGSEYEHCFGIGIQEVDAVGSACIAVKREVFKKVKAPFLESFHKNGTIDLGGDLRFCKRAKSQGFKVAANYDVLCEHYRAIHLNAGADAYINLGFESLKAGD